MDAALLSLEARVDLHDADVQAQIETETSDIDGALTSLTNLTDEHANPDPFTVTVNTCAMIAGSAEVGGELMGGVEVGADGSAGAQAGGNGVKGKLDLQGSSMAKLEVLAAVETVHEVCNAGVELPYEKAHTAQQEQAIDDYETVGKAVQNPGEPVIMASELGMEITDLLDAMDALVALDGLSSNPATLISGDAELDDLITALGHGDTVDTAPMVGTFTDPCSALSGLGGDAAAICDNIDTSFVDSLFAIEDTVDEIDSTLSDFVEDFPGQLDAVVVDLESVITEQTDQALADSVAYTNEVCGDVSGVVNDLREWDLEVNPPGYNINPPGYNINPPTFGINPPGFGIDLGALGDFNINPPTFGINPPAFGIDPPSFGENNILAGTIDGLNCGSN